METNLKYAVAYKIRKTKFFPKTDWVHLPGNWVYHRRLLYDMQTAKNRVREYNFRGPHQRAKIVRAR